MYKLQDLGCENWSRIPPFIVLFTSVPSLEFQAGFLKTSFCQRSDEYLVYKGIKFPEESTDTF